MKAKTIFSMALVFLLGGCQLLRPYKGPLTPTPEVWKTTYDSSDANKGEIPQTWKDNHSESHKKKAEEPKFADACKDLGNWWEIFEDPILNELEQQALDSSYTLWAALEKVIEARALARVNFAPLLPQINFAPSFTRTGSLIENPIPAGFDLGGTQGTTPYASYTQNGGASSRPRIPNSFRFIQTQYLVPLNLNYEIDLWGQLTDNYRAYVMRAQAASQAYLSVLLSLTADVASSYFQLRGLDTQEAVIEKNIEVRQKSVDINSARYKAGLIVYLDVSRAEVELARAHSDKDDIIRLRGLQENILATLVGVPAPIFCIKKNPLGDLPPVIPYGIPSELLCRRPDIAEAERNLAAAYQEIGVAYANFFPSLSLNAALGFESPFGHQLFTWKSRFWQIGASLLQTVFDGGRNQANYDYYRSLFRESMANYQERVLQAFKDVEDSLTNLKGFANQSQDLAVAVKASQTTLQLSQMRYDRGLVNYLDVTDAERSLLETEQNSVIVLANRYVATVNLIRALGGGWGPCDNGCEGEDEIVEYDPQTAIELDPFSS